MAYTPPHEVRKQITKQGLYPSLEKVVNVASVPKRSVFRYPGGKTWLIPHVRRWLMSKSPAPAYFVEPFAGGGIAGLTAAFEDLAKQIILTEIDENVAAVWRVILNGRASKLATKIETYELTSDNIKSSLSADNGNLLDLAFATILRNRVQHGGIMAPGAGLMKFGENGKGVGSRWYAATLAKRIRDIAKVKDKITFNPEDGFDTIKRYARHKTAVFFVDPPYTVAGRRLYAHGVIDHEKLFSAMSKVTGDPLLTYDDSDEVRGWAKQYGFDCTTVAMKSRQHTGKKELLIGRNLGWARD